MLKYWCTPSTTAYFAQSYYLLNCIIDTVGKSHIFQTYNHFAAKAIITWMQSHSQTPSTNVQY